MTVAELIAQELGVDNEYISTLENLITNLIGNKTYDVVLTPGAGSTEIDGNIINMTLPIAPNMYVPVDSVNGKVSFAYVDRKAMFVHELSHLALQLMGLDSELNNARLAAAINAAGGPANIVAIKQNLSPTSTISPDALDASFENVFNNERHYYSTLTGTQEGNLYRTGYYSDGDGWTPPYVDSYTAAKENGWDIALIGNEQINNLTTGAGNDLLDGGFGGDTLDGGSGFDTYIAGNQDTIEDSDGQGNVDFQGITLTGGTFKSSSGGYKTYEGNGGLYILEQNGTLRFAKNGNFITINKFDQVHNDLGITLKDEELELTVIGHTTNENSGTVTGKVYLAKAYSQDIIVHLSTLDDSAKAGSDYTAKSDIQVTIKAGQLDGEFSVNVINDLTKEGRENFFAQIDSVTDTSNQPITYTIADIQPLTIEDDDGLNVSVFAPVVKENTGVATGIVTLSRTFDQAVSVTLYTQNGTATAREDYDAREEGNYTPSLNIYKRIAA